MSLQKTLELILEAYQSEQGIKMSSALRDLLTDTMHLAEKNGYIFEELLQGAREVYEEERDEPSQEDGVIYQPKEAVEDLDSPRCRFCHSTELKALGNNGVVGPGFCEWGRYCKKCGRMQ